MEEQIITFSLIHDQNERIIAELSQLRDDIRLLKAAIKRLDANVEATTIILEALHKRS